MRIEQNISRVHVDLSMLHVRNHSRQCNSTSSTSWNGMIVAKLLLLIGAEREEQYCVRRWGRSDRQYDTSYHPIHHPSSISCDINSHGDRAA
jgi:hypothetical protein